MAAAMVKIHKLKFELLPHPAHSPDLTPFHYHIFGSFKDVLHGCWFVDDDEVKDVVHTWLHSQPKTYFADGISKLMDQNNKYMEKLWDYIEKWHIFSCAPFVEQNKFSLLFEFPSYMHHPAFWNFLYHQNPFLYRYVVAYGPYLGTACLKCEYPWIRMPARNELRKIFLNNWLM